MKFKLYEDFQKSRSFQRSLDIAIYVCLSKLSPTGGNNGTLPIRVDWEDKSPMFNLEGPDLFRNFTIDDARQFSDEIVEISKVVQNNSLKHLVFKEFDDYSLILEKFETDEIIVWVKHSGKSIQTIETDLDQIVNFYKKRESRIKEIEKRWNIHFTSKRYGL